uniref:Uncharacterized protein n=1 Tax=Romanomermis culicivorax TaxID=13658 RepID=A0A915I808_ROMCU
MVSKSNLDAAQKVVYFDMQSRAGASRGGMRRKRSYIEPILPTHNRTMQTNWHFHNNVINRKQIA